MVRHGDVLLIRVGDRPSHAPAPTARRHIVALGEAMGHTHVLEAPCVAQGDTITVLEPGRLTHDEHRAIPLAPGVYEVRRQREMIAEWGTTPVIRSVRD